RCCIQVRKAFQAAPFGVQPPSCWINTGKPAAGVKPPPRKAKTVTTPAAKTEVIVSLLTRIVNAIKNAVSAPIQTAKLEAINKIPGQNERFAKSNAPNIREERKNRRQI